MGYWDDWGGCMDTMGMPTPSEVFHGVEEAFHKLHELELALGGLSLHEALESLEAAGVPLHAVPLKEAAGVTVAWWAGNAVGCMITAGIGDQITDVIEFFAGPSIWPIAEQMMLQANYPPPDLSGFRGSPEEVSMSTSSTAQDDAPPPPILEPDCDQSDWVEYLQGLLNQFGANPQLVVDGKFGPKTTAAVRAFKEANGLDGSPTVDVHVWRALGAYNR